MRYGSQVPVSLLDGQVVPCVTAKKLSSISAAKS